MTRLTDNLLFVLIVVLLGTGMIILRQRVDQLSAAVATLELAVSGAGDAAAANVVRLRQRLDELEAEHQRFRCNDLASMLSLTEHSLYAEREAKVLAEKYECEFVVHWEGENER